MSEISTGPRPNNQPCAPCTAPPDAASVCSYELEAVAGPTAPILVLSVAGEIDLSTLPGLEYALAAAIAQRPATLVIDLAAVTFSCGRGYDALLARAAAAARTNGTGYAVSGLRPNLHHIAALLPAWQRCVHYRSAAAAVAALRIEQAR